MDAAFRRSATAVRRPVRIVVAVALLLCSAGVVGANGQMDESRVVIEGGAARAVAVAHAAFAEAVPDASIDRYEVVIRTGDDAYAVTFLPKLAEGERPQRGGGTSLGPEWSAQVSRTDFSITRQGFAR